MLVKPLAIDLYCGLGGWSEGLLAEGYRVIGFDIERHVYGDQHYPAPLVLQDVLTLYGSQFRDAALIVASPPCQAYSYMAMPWKRAKAMAATIRAAKTGSDLAVLNRLFDACFRIQREASEAAGHHIPMVVENVKGAQPWVGKAQAHFGSFYLWGDIAMVGNRIVLPQPEFGAAHTRAYRSAKPDSLPPLNGHDDPRRGRDTRNGSWFGIGADGKSNLRDGQKTAVNFHDHEKGQPGRSFQSAAVAGLKRPGQSISAGFNNWPKDESGAYILPDGSRAVEGVKQEGLSGPAWFDHGAAHLSSRSSARKAASAQIAKIPEKLARFIAAAYHPSRGAAA